MAGDYDIGYGRPPKRRQFKKGQSGNRKGRPKGSRNLKTLILGELERTVTIREDGVPRKVSGRAGIAKRVLEKALRGDPKSILLILEIDRENTPDDQRSPLPEEDRNILEHYVERNRPKRSPSRSRKRNPRNDN